MCSEIHEQKRKLEHSTTAIRVPFGNYCWDGLDASKLSFLAKQNISLCLPDLNL